MYLDLTLQNEYLSENSKRSQALDKSRISRIQTKGITFDPLVNQEQEPKQEITETKKELQCNSCNWVWTYTGKRYKGFTNCPKCKHNVRINPKQNQK
jgi:hypothetical protein